MIAMRRGWACRSADNRGKTVTSRDSEFQKPHRGVVAPSWSVNEGSLLPTVATQPPGHLALRSTATHGSASTLTLQSRTLGCAPWRTDFSPALVGGSFEHFKTSVRPPPLLAPSSARWHSPTVVSALCGAQLHSFTVFEPSLSADKNRQCVIVALSSQCYCTLFVLLLHHRCKQRRCYCSISRINNRRFSSQVNPPAMTIYFLKSIHSYSILSHTDIYRLGASLCYSATSSTTGKSVRHLEWIRNSCYCIEVLPREVPRFPRRYFSQS